MAYNYTGFSTADIYNSVINDVINGVKEAFLDEDVDLDVLQNIRKEWIDRVEATGCVDKKPNKPHVIPPPMRQLAPVGRVTVQGGIPRTFQMQGNQQYLKPFGEGTQLIPVQYVNSQQGQQPLLILQNAPQYVAPQPQQPRFIQTAQGLVELQDQDPDVIPRNTMYQLDGSNDRTLDEEDKEIVKKSLKKAEATEKKTKKSLHRLMNTVQLDGNGATMSDSSSEDEDFDPLRRLVDKITDRNEGMEEQQAIEEEPPLNSDDDEEGENLDQIFETENVIICQFEKVNRTRTKWKLNLKDGIMHINNRDHCFTKSVGEATF